MVMHRSELGTVSQKRSSRGSTAAWKAFSAFSGGSLMRLLIVAAGVRNHITALSTKGSLCATLSYVNDERSNDLKAP